MLRISRTWPFLLGMLLVYLAPATIGLVMTLSGESDATAAAVAKASWAYLALLVYPVAGMVVGFFAGLKIGGVWLVPVLAAVLSLPFSVQFLGTTVPALVTAAIYFAIYLGFGLVGWFLGDQIHKRQHPDAPQA